MDLNSPFDLTDQHSNTDHKITVVLSRLSDLYRQLLWSKAQPIGISPIQVQLLLFIKHHSSDLNKVSHFSKEFQLTKATISDSIRVLVEKQLLEKVSEKADRRSFYLKLTLKGESLASEAEGFTIRFQDVLNEIGQPKKDVLFESLYGLLNELNQSGVIPVQRMCFGCNFYEGDKTNQHNCTFLKRKLNTSEIRIDCAEFKSA